MFRILIIIIIFTSCQYTKDDIYVNKNFDIVIRSHSSILLYTKGCILPYKIIDDNNKNYISSGIFGCTIDGMDGSYYPLQIEMKYMDDRIIITSENICFSNSKLSNNNEFFKINKHRYDFNGEDPFSDFLRSSKTIIHESIHADFWREINNLLPDGKNLTNVDQSTFDETFREFIDIICTEGDNLSDQHEVMINKWINKIANDLWEINNKVGNPNDYLYLAWLGLYRKNNDCINSILTINEYKNMKINYINNIQNNDQTRLNEKIINDCINNN